MFSLFFYRLLSDIISFDGVFGNVSLSDVICDNNVSIILRPSLYFAVVSNK